MLITMFEIPDNIGIILPNDHMVPYNPHPGGIFIYADQIFAELKRVPTSSARVLM